MDTPQTKNNLRGWLIVAVAFLADAISLGARALFVVSTILYYKIRPPETKIVIL